MHQLIETAEPFLFPGSRTGCLLIHGFTGTPKEMRWLGEHLAAQGFSVLGIRLAGHATRPGDMLRSHWTDWVASVEDGYHLLRGLADRIYLIGLSMGGVLSLLASTRLPMNGVVAISTLWRLPDDWRLNYVGLLGRVWRFMPKGSAEPGSGWFDKDAWKDHVSYPQNPVLGIGELNELLAEMRAHIAEVRVPVLLIHSKHDQYVVPENMEHLQEALVNAPERTKLLITNSGHVVTRDAARSEVFDAVTQFILRLEPQAQ